MKLSEFFYDVTGPNVKEFLESPADIRLAINAAWSLDALAPHLFEAMQGTGCLVPRSDSKFKENLADKERSFKLVWDLSTAAKHARPHISTKLVRSTDEFKIVNAEGFLAFFAGIADHNEWGERIFVENDAYGLRTVDDLVKEAFEFMRKECSGYLNA